MAAISVPNIPNGTARRVWDYLFELRFQFRLDDAPWNITNPAVKMDVFDTSGVKVTTWSATAWTYPDTSTILIRKETPAAVNLEMKQYVVQVYQENGGKILLFTFDLFIDPTVNNVNRSSYASGPKDAEAFQYSLKGNVPTLTTI